MLPRLKLTDPPTFYRNFYFRRVNPQGLAQGFFQTVHSSLVFSNRRDPFKSSGSRADYRRRRQSNSDCRSVRKVPRCLAPAPTADDPVRWRKIITIYNVRLLLLLLHVTEFYCLKSAGLRERIGVMRGDGLLRFRAIRLEIKIKKKRTCYSFGQAETVGRRATSLSTPYSSVLMLRSQHYCGPFFSVRVNDMRARYSKISRNFYRVFTER